MHQQPFPRSVITLTQEFRLSAGLPVANTLHQPTTNDMFLNLSLMLEELTELAEAYGVKRSFLTMCLDKATLRPDFEDTYVYNQLEVLDALADLAVVHAGCVLTSGMQHVFHEASLRVFRSNMTKVGLSAEQAEAEAKRYTLNNQVAAVASYAGATNQWVIRRRSDGKLLKPSTFVAPDLSLCFPSSGE